MDDREKKVGLAAGDEGGPSGEGLEKLSGVEPRGPADRPAGEVGLREMPGDNNEDAAGQAGGETEGAGGEPAAGPGEAPGDDDRERLARMLAEEKARAEDYFNRLLRMQADFENYRKRVAREREDLLKYANEQLIMALLPVIDNFDRALSAKNDNSEKLLAGVEMISRQLCDILAKEGLEAVPAVGEQFNPEFHEAVMKEETGDYPENTVTEELRRGYLYKGRVIRPAMVKVRG